MTYQKNCWQSNIFPFSGGWMNIPQGIPNCPQGLEYLTSIDQLLVKQKVELLEAFTGFETNNKFTIKNSLGQKVGFDKTYIKRSCEYFFLLTSRYTGPSRKMTVVHVTVVDLNVRLTWKSWTSIRIRWSDCIDRLPVTPVVFRAVCKQWKSKHRPATRSEVSSKSGPFCVRRLVLKMRPVRLCCASKVHFAHSQCAVTLSSRSVRIYF